MFDQGHGTTSSSRSRDDLPNSVALSLERHHLPAGAAAPSTRSSRLGVARPVAGANITLVVTARASPAALVDATTAASPDDVDAGDDFGTATVDVAELAHLGITEAASPTGGMRGRAAGVQLDGPERGPRARPSTAGRGVRPAGPRRVRDPERRRRSRAGYGRDDRHKVDVFQGWLEGQTAGRRLRVDTAGGQLDISFFRLARTDAEIASHGPFVRDEIEDELTAAGFADRGRSTAFTTTDRARLPAAAAPGRPLCRAPWLRCTCRASRQEPHRARPTRSRAPVDRRATSSTR